jgi:hypothetical protein
MAPSRRKRLHENSLLDDVHPCCSFDLDRELAVNAQVAQVYARRLFVPQSWGLFGAQQFRAL